MLYMNNEDKMAIKLKYIEKLVNLRKKTLDECNAVLEDLRVAAKTDMIDPAAKKLVKLIDDDFTAEYKMIDSIRLVLHS